MQYSYPESIHESLQQPETNWEFPIAPTGTRMALATSIPHSFGPCAWSGNQFGCNPFSPWALVGKGGLCWARRDGGGVSPGLVIAAPSARAFLCAKPWGAKGDWGYGGKGLGKKVRRERDGGCGERRWLLATLESPWSKKYLMCGQFPSLWMTMRWWGLSLEPQWCWPTLEQWGHVEQQDLCGVDGLMIGWASLASSSYLTLRQEGWGLLSVPLSLGTCLRNGKGQWDNPFVTLLTGSHLHTYFLMSKQLPKPLCALLGAITPLLPRDIPLPSHQAVAAVISRYQRQTLSCSSQEAKKKPCLVFLS